MTRIDLHTHNSRPFTLVNNRQRHLFSNDTPLCVAPRGEGVDFLSTSAACLFPANARRAVSLTALLAELVHL